MKEQLADLLSSWDGEIHKDYSGRGMFGNTTTAISFENENDFYNAIGAIIQDGDPEELKELAEFLNGTVRTDSLGHEIIIY